MSSNPRSNVNIRSNLYPMPCDPCDMNSYLKIHHIVGTGHPYDEHIRFLKQIKDFQLFSKLPNGLKHLVTDLRKGAFEFCSAHPNNVLTYGPIRKKGGIVYGCRCDLRDTCRYKIISNQDCSTCTRNKD